MSASAKSTSFHRLATLIPPLRWLLMRRCPGLNWHWSWRRLCWCCRGENGQWLWLRATRYGWVHCDAYCHVGTDPWGPTQIDWKPPR
jgi:hypothetical protein